MPLVVMSCSIFVQKSVLLYVTSVHNRNFYKKSALLQSLCKKTAIKKCGLILSGYLYYGIDGINYTVLNTDVCLKTLALHILLSCLNQEYQHQGTTAMSGKFTIHAKFTVCSYKKNCSKEHNVKM